MEENKNCKSNDELMDDSLDAVAGGKGGKKEGWTEEQKKELRDYCSNFYNPEKKFQELITKYKTYDKFNEMYSRNFFAP